ncbi:MAG: nucleotidyltransferase family protein [Asticcacaulis sp.]
MKATDVDLILLAAGRSERFGAADKLLCDLGGAPVGLWAARTLSGLNWRRKWLVTEAPGLAGACVAMGFVIVPPPFDGAGMGDNLAHVASLTGGQGVAVFLADMPFVTSDHAEALLAAIDERYPVAISTADGIDSPPAVFSGHFAEGLKTLTGDQGARRIIAGNRVDIRRVAAPPDSLFDIDTPAALEAAQSRVAMKKMSL